MLPGFLLLCFLISVFSRMASFATILAATVPVFLIVGAGFFAQRRNWLTEELEVGVIKLGLNLLFPCYILSLLPGNPALEKVSTAGWAIGIGFTLVTVGFAVSWLIGLVARFKRGGGLRTFILCSGIQNYGFLALPIAISLFPGNTGPAGLVFVHGVGVEIALWTVGLWIMSGKSGFRSIINGPFVAVLVSLILNYTGLYRWIPEILVTTMEMLGRCAVPMAVLMIGATIGRFATRGILLDAPRVAASSVLARLVVAAIIILCSAKFLPISADLKRLLVIQAAMPAAIFPIALARLYEGQPQVAIQVVIVTSLVGIISIPFVIAWGLGWVNP